MPAARVLLISRAEVELAVLRALRIERRCPSCRFSRAPYNAVEIAQVRNVLPIYRRRCIRQPTYKRCPHWQRLEVPAAVLAEDPVVLETEDVIAPMSDRAVGKLV